MAVSGAMPARATPHGSALTHHEMPLGSPTCFLEVCVEIAGFVPELGLAVYFQQRAEQWQAGPIPPQRERLAQQLRPSCTAAPPKISQALTRSMPGHAEGGELLCETDSLASHAGLGSALGAPGGSGGLGWSEIVRRDQARLRAAALVP